MSVKITRVFDLLKHNLENFPKDEFVSGKINGKWHKYSTAQFCKEVDSIRTLTNEVVEKFIPALIPIAQTLTPKQIEKWNKYQEERDKEFIENIQRKHSFFKLIN